MRLQGNTSFQHPGGSGSFHLAGKAGDPPEFSKNNVLAVGREGVMSKWECYSEMSALK